MSIMMKTTLLPLLLLTACAPQVVPVTVGAPKVWGDDHVLASLAVRQREVRALAGRAALEAAPVQESFAVRHDASSRLAAGLDLTGGNGGDAGEAPAAPSHPRDCGCPRCARVVGAPVRLLAAELPRSLGPSSAELFAGQLDLADLVASTERVAAGDATLLDRRSRAVLLRFDVCFNGHQELGDRRGFVVVAFVVRARPGRDGHAPPFVVYRLAPEVRSLVTDEQLVDRAADEVSVDALAAWGGTGLTGGWSSRDQLTRRFEAVLATPLQHGIYRSGASAAGDDFTFAFAFGPRRRLVERSLLNPARWFGDPFVVAHELLPGPRSCEAVLVFRDVDPDEPLELAVSVHCDGELVSEERLDVTRALGRPLDTFQVRCPAEGGPRGARRVALVPTATTDALLDAGESGAVFSQASRVLVGPVAIPAADVQLVGRGRLALRVRPTLALALLAQQGVRVVPCRVLTPDQPDFELEVELVGAAR